MVKALDKYVFKEALRFFLLSLLTFVVLFFVIDFVSNFNLISKLGFKESLIYVMARIPLYLSRILPIAMLISSMVTLSTFSATSELTVARALGISIYRFSLPILFLAFFVSLFSLFLQEFLIPPTMKMVKELELKLKPSKENNQMLLSVWFKSKDRFVFFDQFFPEENRACRISVFYLKGFKPIKRIDALEGKSVEEKFWVLKEGVERDVEKGVAKTFKKKVIKLGVKGKEITFIKPEPKTMELLSLFLTAKRMAYLGYNVSELLVDLYSRLSLSFLPVVVALIGIPLGTYNPRNRRGWTVAIAAAIIVFMWITISLFLSFGKSGVLPPLYSTFAPLLFFLSVGLILFSRVEG